MFLQNIDKHINIALNISICKMICAILQLCPNDTLDKLWNFFVFLCSPLNKTHGFCKSKANISYEQLWYIKFYHGFDNMDSLEDHFFRLVILSSPDVIIWSSSLDLLEICNFRNFKLQHKPLTWKLKWISITNRMNHQIANAVAWKLKVVDRLIPQYTVQ